MDNITINDTKVNAITPNELINEIFLMIPNIQYWSYDALVELYKGIIDVVLKFSDQVVDEFKGKYKTAYTKFLNSNYVMKMESRDSKTKYRTNIRKRLFIPRTRESILEFIYEMIMKGYNCSLLRNLGVTNKLGDDISGNPERDSIYEVRRKNDNKGLPEGLIKSIERDREILNDKYM